MFITRMITYLIRILAGVGVDRPQPFGAREHGETASGHPSCVAQPAERDVTLRQVREGCGCRVPLHRTPQAVEVADLPDLLNHARHEFVPFLCCPMTLYRHIRAPG